MITTVEEAYGEYHDGEQQISTLNDGFDFASCGEGACADVTASPSAGSQRSAG